MFNQFQLIIQFWEFYISKHIDNPISKFLLKKNIHVCHWSLLLFHSPLLHCPPKTHEPGTRLSVCGTTHFQQHSYTGLQLRPFTSVWLAAGLSSRLTTNTGLTWEYAECQRRSDTPAFPRRLSAQSHLIPLRFQLLWSKSKDHKLIVPDLPSL